MWKKYIVINLVIFLAFLAASIVCLFPVVDHGTQTYDKTRFLDYITDKKVRLISEDSKLLENKEHYLTSMEEGRFGVHHKLQVYVVTPDNNPMVQKNATYEQTVKVVDVISGSVESGRQLIVYIPGGFTVIDDEAVYIGNYYKNYMQQQNYYLLFCEKIEYPEDEDWYVRAIPGLMNVLRINADDAEFADDDEPEAVWENFKNRELFTTSNEILREFNTLKHEMFEKWGIDCRKFRDDGGAV